jgi:hypothetical protein
MCTCKVILAAMASTLAVLAPSAARACPSCWICPSIWCPGDVGCIPDPTQNGNDCGPKGPCGYAHCNAIGQCNHSYSPGTLCRGASGPCDEGGYCINGAVNCPANTFKPAGTACRAAAGVCDNAEYCTGTSAACPADAFKPATTVCRAAAGVCDVAEYCTGTSASCPADAFQPASAVCRAAAGVCDVAEYCTGTSASCPADAFQPASAVCRAAAGVCDNPEYCTGTSASCPADAFQPASTVCRPAAGVCDVAEYCAGTSASCPADVKAPNGTSCSALDACLAGGACTSGVCLGGVPEFTFDPAQVAITGTQQVTVTVTHSGSKNAIQLTGASVTPADKFTIVTQPTWPVTLATGQSTTLVVALATTTAGTYDGALDLEATNCADVTVALAGTVEASQGGSGGGGGKGGCSSAGAVGGMAVGLGALAAFRRRRS